MEDRLDEFIQTHRMEFDNMEPPDDLWNKIQKKEPEAKIRKLNWANIMWKAAAVVIIFMASFVVQRYLMKPVQQTADTQEQHKQEILIPEVAEAEIYYTSQLTNKLNEINRLADCYPELRDVINTDFSELDSVYLDLKKDLKDDVANEEVINAMIQNYRLKLQILEDLLYQVKKLDCNNESNNDNTNENEGYDI